MNIKRIYFRILSIINILFINIDIIFNKVLKKKIIVFFHPRGDLKSISDYYINPLFKSKYKNHKVYILENSSKFFLSNTLIEESFVKYILGIDVFFNNYLCDTFPNNCKKIFIHHDIYDTPIANRKVYKEISKSNTYTRLKELNMFERENEIASMLSGEKMTMTAKKHARELLD